MSMHDDEKKTDKLTDKQKLDLIRMRVGLTLGLAAKNDNRGMISLSTDIIKILDDKKTY